MPSAWAFIAGGGVFDHKSFGPPTELPSPLFLPPGSRKTKALQTGRAGAREWTDCGLCAFGRRVGLGGTASSNGRSLNVLADEPLQLQLRRAAATPESREQLRERVKVEHRLAHHAQKQGRKARYLGLRNNLFEAHLTHGQIGAPCRVAVCCKRLAGPQHRSASGEHSRKPEAALFRPIGGIGNLQ